MNEQTHSLLPVKPLLRGHFHQAMFFTALGACLPLILSCESTLEFIAILVYTICVLVMFGVSTLYHRITWSPVRRALWRKLDHAGIYLMIAGTATPIALLGMDAISGKKFLITIWIAAFIGILQSVFFVNLPKYISALIYLGTGMLVLPYLPELKNSIGPVNSWFILAGGIVYGLGALSYGLKKPILYPRVFSYHEVFHLFVNLGAVLHFVVIYSLIK
jgi:hemolysin III